MSKFVTLHGFDGGSSELNFDVVAYDSEEALLAATPAENTIGVVTSNEITSWNFMSTEPTDPTDGMVWFKVDDKSGTGFNALKKNSILVCPISAKQYVSGKDVEVTAMIYRGNEWGELVSDTYLFNAGDECTEITGGWVAFQISDEGSLYSSGCKKENGELVLKLPTSRRSVGFGTENMINLTDYASVEFTVTSIKTCIRFGVSKTRDTDTYENWAAVTEINKDENMDLPADNIVRVDVSNLTGTYYVAFGDWHTEYAEEVHVSAVKLVR